jgi:hypothetical protein
MRFMIPPVAIVARDRKMFDQLHPAVNWRLGDKAARLWLSDGSENYRQRCQPCWQTAVLIPERQL